MRRYIAKFTGRKLRATGICFKIKTITEGKTRKAAILALYDRFELIQRLELMPHRISVGTRTRIDK